jgi:hypothetical protein
MRLSGLPSSAMQRNLSKVLPSAERIDSLNSRVRKHGLVKESSYTDSQNTTQMNMIQEISTSLPQC